MSPFPSPSSLRTAGRADVSPCGVYRVFWGLSTIRLLMTWNPPIFFQRNADVTPRD